MREKREVKKNYSHEKGKQRVGYRWVDPSKRAENMVQVSTLS